MPLTVNTPPAALPLDLSELKDHLNLEGTDRFDTYLDLLIEAIVTPAQNKLGQQFIAATLVWTVPAFRRKMELPRPPLQAVTKVEYRDVDGVWQTVPAENYQVNTDARPGFVRFAGDYELPPIFTNEEYPWRFTYKAGYQGDGEASTYQQVPSELRLWMMNLIGSQFMKREADMISAGSVDVVALEKQMARLVRGHNLNRRFG